MPLTPPPNRIDADEVRLILFTPADVADMLAGRRQPRWHPQYPQRSDVDAAGMSASSGSWGPRHIVLGMQAVGSVGCLGRPADGEAEMRFGVVEAVRRQGVARAALAALLPYLDAGGVVATARVAPRNAAAMKLLAGVGFTDLRCATDDDELVLARPLPRSPA